MRSIRESTLLEQVRSTLPWWRKAELWVTQRELMFKPGAPLSRGDTQQLSGALEILDDMRRRIAVLLPETLDVAPIDDAREDEPAAAAVVSWPISSPPINNAEVFGTAREVRAVPEGARRSRR